MATKTQPATVTTVLKYREDTLGIYYTDQDGAHWSTVHCTGGLVCTDCGKRLTAGYIRSALAGPERTVCGCQVRAVYPRRKHR